MLGLTHPGQVEHEPAGTNPRMWGLTQLPSYGCSGGTGSPWGPSSLCRVHFSWEFHLRPWLGGAAVEVPADACAASSPAPAGSAGSWEQQPQQDLCCGAAHPWRAGGSLALASSHSSLGMCSERMCQGTLRCNWSQAQPAPDSTEPGDPKNTSHSLPELSSAWF